MQVYRILKEKYKDQPLSVVGAELSGGRWNPAQKDRGLLYTSTEPSLAILEILVHLNHVPYAHLPTLWLTTIQLPDKPGLVRYLSEPTLPEYWKINDPRSQTILLDWIDAPKTLGMGVPSSILPISYNVLLNPRDGLYSALTVIDQRKLPLDRRLWRINTFSPLYRKKVKPAEPPSDESTKKR